MRTVAKPFPLGRRPTRAAHRAWSARGQQRAGVPRLVQAESSPAGQVDGRDEPPALLRHAATDLDAPRSEIPNGGLYVVAHQIELTAAATRRRGVRGQLRRGEREDEPAVTGVNRSQPQDV